MEKLNWEFMMKVLPLYREALWLTLRLGLCGTALATAVGLLCAAIQYEKVPVLRQIVAGYIELSRNTPLLIQLFFIYYGLPKIGIKTDPAVCGVVGLAFLGGSYMAEAFRSGLEAIEPIQQESALSLGLTRGQTMRYCDIAAGHEYQHAGLYGECDLPAEGNQRIQCGEPDGPDVYRQGSHSHVRQNHRGAGAAGGVLSAHSAAGFSAGQLAGKEAALCLTWDWRYC